MKIDRMMGINVRSDKQARRQYADLIVDGFKTLETRNSDSLRPYVGKVVAIVRTGMGKAQAIGTVRVGEPVSVGSIGFRALAGRHMVPAWSQFDCLAGRTKWVYPLTEAIKFASPREVGFGIIAREVFA